MHSIIIEKKELREYFKVGEEIETYSSLDECLDKISYYLEHEDVRQKIAEAGYEKVKKEFSYEKGLGRLLNC